MDPFERIAAEPGGAETSVPTSDDAVSEESSKGSVWRKLLEPTSKKPRDFDDDMIAEWVNRKADDRSGVEAANEAELGQSAALCVDALGGPTGLQSSPAFYMARSTWRWVRLVRQAKAAQAGARV